MSTVANSSWLAQALRLMPTRLVRALDAWSYRVALRHAERRRRAASVRKLGPSQPTLPQYKLRPWTD